MRTAQAALGFLTVQPVTWRADWVWGVPLIVLTLIIHVLGLELINQRAVRPVRERMQHLHRRTTAVFVVVLGAAAVLTTLLHAIEAGIWAAVYLRLGALPDNKSAMLYSLSAITSYGHANMFLESHWQLMGAIEALNGWLLFGLTTAFLFGVIEKIGLLTGRRESSA